MSVDNRNTVPDERRMSLSDSIELLHGLREMCEKGGFNSHAEAIDTVCWWVNEMVTVISNFGRH